MLGSCNTHIDHDDDDDDDDDGRNDSYDDDHSHHHQDYRWLHFVARRICGHGGGGGSRGDQGVRGGGRG